MRWRLLYIVVLLATLAVVMAENEDRQKQDSLTITKVTNGKDCNKAKAVPSTQPLTVHPKIESAYTSTLISRLQECLKTKSQQETIQNAGGWMQPRVMTNQLYLPYQDVIVPPVKPPLLYSYTDEFGREVPFVLEEDAAGEYTASFGVPQPLVSVPEPVPMIQTIVSPVIPEVIVDTKPFYIDVPVKPVITVSKDCKNGSKTEAPPNLPHLSVSPFYSNTQENKDGSTITTANNGEVTVSQTNDPMPPPPPYIINRLENILHGTTYGVAPLPALSNVVITKPNWSTVPLRIPEKIGAYSYTQLNKDGSQTHFNSGEYFNKPSKGSSSENNVKIPVVPPVVPLVVPNPAVTDPLVRPLFYSRPSMNSVRLPSGSYSYIQIHKNGSASNQGNSRQAGQHPVIVKKANFSKITETSQDKETSVPYSYIQLNRRGSPSSFTSGESADKRKNDIVVPVVPPQQPFYFLHPMNNAVPSYSGGYSYSQNHNDGSSSNHGISTIASASSVNMPVTSPEKNVQSSGSFSYTQIHSGTAPSSLSIDGTGILVGKVENKLVVPVVSSNANKPSYPLHYSPEVNAKPVQAQSGSYSYTQIHKDGLTSINGGSSASASKPISVEVTPKQNEHSSGGFSYTQINNGGKGKAQATTSITSSKPIPLQINSGYSYTQVHKGDKIATTPCVETEKAESTTGKVHHSIPLNGSGSYSFTQVHKDGTSSNIVNSAAPNGSVGIKGMIGSIPPPPKHNRAPTTQTVPSSYTVTSKMNNGQPILSKYMYKQISHSNPNPDAFTVVNVEDKKLKTFSNGKFTNGVVPVPTMLEIANAPEVSEIPSGFVYMPPASNVEQPIHFPDDARNRVSVSFKNNPIIVEDVTPVQQFSYTQKKSDGSMVKINTEGSHSVRVDQNKEKEPSRSRHRGDIPDSEE